MRSFRHILLTASVVVLALGSESVANPCLGVWVRITNNYVPDDPPLCSISGVEQYASVDVAALAGTMSGVGQAQDQQTGGDILKIGIATSLREESWQFYPLLPGSSGWVRFRGEVSAEGMVNLIDADCAAAAIGFIECDSNITDPAVCALTRSAAETAAGSLGDVEVAYGPFSGEFSVSTGSGEGEYPDECLESQENPGVCIDTFWWKHRAQPYVKVWANGGPWPFNPSSCEAELSGEATCTYFLDCCYQAPIPVKR